MTDNKKATAREVATLAGVSIQTVSRVLNEHPYVSDETRQRVIDAIKQLDYRPDTIARRLMTRRSFILGVVVADIDNGSQNRLMGIEKQCAALGYSLLLSVLHHFDLETISQLLERLIAHQVDGIVWAVPEHERYKEQIRALLHKVSVPLMFLSGRASNDFPTVFTDNRMGGRLATEHLIGQGYRNIGLITGPLVWAAARARQLGWQDALALTSIPAEARRIVESDWTPHGGERAFHQLIGQFPEMDAVFVGNDHMALGALQAAHTLGMRIPEELGMVGYDATPESAQFWPPLTTVQQHLLEVGSTGVTEIVQLIEQRRRGETNGIPPCIGIQPQLVVRRSSGALE